MLKQLVILLALLTPIIGMAQHPSSWQYTDVDGLSSMTIYDLFQDKQGYLWMGTANGICKFDGLKFTSISSELLESNEILQVGQDQWGRIYCLNLKGQLLQVKDGGLEKLYAKQALLDSISIRDLTFEEGCLFIIDTNWKLHLIELDEEGEIDRVHRLNSNAQVSNVCIYQQDTLIIGMEEHHTIAKLFHIDGFHNQSPQLSMLQLIPRGKNGTIQRFHEHQNELYIYNSHSLYHHGTGHLNTFPQASSTNRINIIGDDFFWLAREGVFINYQDYHSKAEVPVWLAKKNINSGFQDREGNIWVGTTGSGLFCIPNTAIRHWNEESFQLPNANIYALTFAKDSETLFVGLNNGHFVSIQNDAITTPFKIQSMGRVIDLCPISEQQLVVGTDDGLFWYDLLTKRTLSTQKYGAVKDILLDSQQRLWVGSHNSLNRFQADHTPERPTILRNERITTISEDKAGTIWIGTINGLYYYKDQLYPFFEKGEKNVYNVNKVSCSSDSIVWVATERHGLLGIRNQQIIYRIGEEDGLLSNTCKALFAEAEGVVWVGSNKGINKITLPEMRIEKMDKFDGLPSNEINQIYVKNGFVWLGSPKGLVKFPTAHDFHNEVPPAIYVKGVKIWEKDTSLLSTYELAYNQNNLFFSFEGIAYRARSSLQYQYRLLGLDSNWIFTNTRFARYPLLTAGEYTFEVKAINEDGVTSEQAAMIHLRIQKPWWQTNWFRLMMGLLIFALISFLFYSRLRFLQNRQKEQTQISERINNLRMKALQVQMNPHFVFNALNAIQKYLTTNEEEQAMIYLARFARLIRMIFELSKREKISLQEEITFLELYLDMEKLRFRDKVQIQLNIPDTLRNSAENVIFPPLLIQPIVENAFKHGLFHKKEATGKLRISFDLLNDDFLNCTIEDNGVGREKAKKINAWKPDKYQSSGLKTTQERLDILSLSQAVPSQPVPSSIYIEDLLTKDGLACGTKITLAIKYEKAF